MCCRPRVLRQGVNLGCCWSGGSILETWELTSTSCTVPAVRHLTRWQVISSGRVTWCLTPRRQAPGRARRVSARGVTPTGYSWRTAQRRGPSRKTGATISGRHAPIMALPTTVAGCSLARLIRLTPGYHIFTESGTMNRDRVTECRLPASRRAGQRRARAALPGRSASGTGRQGQPQCSRGLRPQSGTAARP